VLAGAVCCCGVPSRINWSMRVLSGVCCANIAQRDVLNTPLYARVCTERKLPYCIYPWRKLCGSGSPWLSFLSWRRSSVVCEGAPHAVVLSSVPAARLRCRREVSLKATQNSALAAGGFLRVAGLRRP
jgi:hypothetical protein